MRAAFEQYRTHPDHVYLGRLAVLPVFRSRGLDSYTGSPEPTFAWFAKPVG